MSEGAKTQEQEAREGGGLLHRLFEWGEHKGSASDGESVRVFGVTHSVPFSQQAHLRRREKFMKLRSSTATGKSGRRFSRMA